MEYDEAFIIRAEDNSVVLFKFCDVDQGSLDYYQLSSDIRTFEDLNEKTVEFVNVTYSLDYDDADGIMELSSVGLIELELDDSVYKALLSEDTELVTSLYMTIKAYSGAFHKL